MDKEAMAARFGYIQLVDHIGRIREEGGTTGEMDRRALMERLCAELGVDQATLLERGFDKAYRRIVEGI